MKDAGNKRLIVFVIMLILISKYNSSNNIRRKTDNTVKEDKQTPCSSVLKGRIKSLGGIID